MCVCVCVCVCVCGGVSTQLMQVHTVGYISMKQMNIREYANINKVLRSPNYATLHCRSSSTTLHARTTTRRKKSNTALRSACLVPNYAQWWALYHTPVRAGHLVVVEQREHGIVIVDRTITFAVEVGGGNSCALELKFGRHFHIRLLSFIRRHEAAALKWLAGCVTRFAEVRLPSLYFGNFWSARRTLRFRTGSGLVYARPFSMRRPYCGA